MATAKKKTTAKKKPKARVNGTCKTTTYADKNIAARVAGGHKARGKKVTVSGRTVTVC